MNPMDYFIRIKSGKDSAKDRVSMARIALNTLFDPHVYPVDLSLLSEMSTEAYVLSRSMLTYSRLFPEYYGSLAPDDLEYLQRIVDNRSKLDLESELKASAQGTQEHE